MIASIKSIVITLAFVTVFTLLTSAIVVLTEQKRESNKEAYKLSQLKDLIGLSDNAEINYQPLDIDYPYQAIYINQMGASFNIIEARTTQGYGGEIGVLLLLNGRSEIQGARVLKPHYETPGLGDVIETDKSDWMQQFYHQSLDTLPESQWAIAKEGGVFDAASGATITSRAVTSAIKQALLDWQKVQQHD